MKNILKTNRGVNMELKELEDLSYTLENEAYTLYKSIEALLYVLFPDDDTEENELSNSNHQINFLPSETSP